MARLFETEKRFKRGKYDRKDFQSLVLFTFKFKKHLSSACSLSNSKFKDVLLNN